MSMGAGDSRLRVEVFDYRTSGTISAIVLPPLVGLFLLAAAVFGSRPPGALLWALCIAAVVGLFARSYLSILCYLRERIEKRGTVLTLIKANGRRTVVDLQNADYIFMSGRGTVTVRSPEGSISFYEWINKAVALRDICLGAVISNGGRVVPGTAVKTYLRRQSDD